MSFKKRSLKVLTTALVVIMVFGVCANVFAGFLPLLGESVSAAKLNNLNARNVNLIKQDEHNYSARVGSGVSTIVFDFEKADVNTKIYAYKNNVLSDIDNLFLSYGQNDFTLTTKTKSGVCENYNILITREPPKNNAGFMNDFERTLVEIAFQLLPERHPFVLAYEETYGVDIDSYVVEIDGRRLSGVPFEYGGRGNFIGFSTRWWTPAKDPKYPVGGLDCAEYLHWVYRQAGYSVPENSASLFFAGIEGVEQIIPGVKSHLVIPSLDEAMIGDIGYNSQEFTYKAGHGNHTVMFLGTTDKLGLTAAVRKYYKKFPNKSYIAIDTGWADGGYYYSLMKKLGIKGRSSMCGTGIQFFTSIKGNDGKYIYKSPYLGGGASAKSYSWKDKQTGYTFAVAANLERNKRLFQYKPSKDSTCEYIMNLSRPVAAY